MFNFFKQKEERVPEGKVELTGINTEIRLFTFFNELKECEKYTYLPLMTYEQALKFLHNTEIPDFIVMFSKNKKFRMKTEEAIVLLESIT